MKHLRHLLLIVLTALLATPAIEAKPLKTSHLYMFGFSASFKDSIVYVTDIQDVEGAWIDHKTGFLLQRDQYSAQLKSHLAETLQQPDRVCVVFFNTKKNKAEKQYLKMKKKYKTGYDIRYLNITQFKFQAIQAEEEE